jgi:ABC-2 type transport system ATP-binding protein
VWDLPLRDSFELLQKLYRVDPARHRRNLEEYVELLDLGDLLDTPVRQLSLGQRMRGDITAALLHGPRSSTSTGDHRSGCGEQGRLRDLRTLNAERSTCC